MDALNERYWQVLQRRRPRPERPPDSARVERAYEELMAEAEGRGLTRSVPWSMQGMESPVLSDPGAPPRRCPSCNSAETSVKAGVPSPTGWVGRCLHCHYRWPVKSGRTAGAA